MAEYEKQVEHLAGLAKHPGWKAYIWQRLQDLDQSPLFTGIKADVLRRIESLEPQHTCPKHKQASLEIVQGRATWLAQQPASSNVQRKHGR